MIYLANTKTLKTSDYPDGTVIVYIGRAMPGRPGSPLGNPFKLAKGEAREPVIRRYAAWLSSQKDDSEAAHEIERLTEIARNGDLVLVCWCAPLACHGDVIKSVIEWKLHLQKEAA